MNAQYQIQIDGLPVITVRGLRRAKVAARRLGGDLVMIGDSCGWLIEMTGRRKQRRQWARAH